MRTTCIVIILILITASGISQPCAHDGIGFYTQEEVNTFRKTYPNCLEIIGDVIIAGEGISQLDSLLGVVSIGGYFEIASTINLYTLQGLDSLRKVGKHFGIYGNQNLMMLWNLSSLDSVGENFEVFGNSLIVNMKGLDRLRHVGGSMWIGSNPSLMSMKGLGSLGMVDGAVQIDHNDQLTNLDSMISLRTIRGGIYITSNPRLKSLHGLDSINAGAVSGLYISHNDSLATCSVFSICRYLELPFMTVDVYQNSQGCNTFSEIKAGCDTLSVPADGEEPGFRVYPNPAADFICIESPEEKSINHIRLLDLSGREVLVCTCPQGNNRIDIRSLDPGIYLMTVTGHRGTRNLRLIKS